MGTRLAKEGVISTAVLAAFLSCSSYSGTDPFASQNSPSNGSPSQSAFSFPTPPPTPPIQPEEYEKCYGVAGKDQNDCGYASFDGEPNCCA